MSQSPAIDVAILSVLTQRDPAEVAAPGFMESIGNLLIRDSLTGLYSRRYLQERLRMAVAAPGGRFALLMMDLNGFKRVNDTIGHAAGDQMLVQAARVLQAAAPPDSAVVRYGGDEFIVLVPGSDEQEARRVALSVLDGLSRALLQPAGGPPLHGMSGSIGIAAWPQDADEPGRLIAAADQAMYHAKHVLNGGLTLFRSLSAHVGSSAGALLNASGAAPVTVLCAQVGTADGHTAPAGYLDRCGTAFALAVEAAGGTVWKWWPACDSTTDQTPGRYYAAAVFAGAPQALAAAVSVQQRLMGAPTSGATGPVVALHATMVGQGDQRDTVLDRAAHLASTGHGGQILFTRLAARLLGETEEHVIALRDLGPHRLSDLRDPEHVHQVLHPGLPRDFPNLRSLSTIANNLPAQFSQFIGRDADMAALTARIARHRLVTLVGPGGTGKTRLAVQTAALLARQFRDGVLLVELAATANPRLVVNALAWAVGAREEPGSSPLDAVVSALQSKEVLLLLDNCEHVLDASARLVHTVLATCPEVRIIATSREALTLPGEATCQVLPLTLPPPSPPPVLAELERSAAVRLFVDRLRLHQADFRATPENGAVVAAICRQLDGIPLALELAAACGATQTVDEIAHGLANRFGLLTRGSRVGLPRQRTLRALVDWSYDALSAAERVLWRRLSVFAGSFAPEAAAAICADQGDGSSGHSSRRRPHLDHTLIPGLLDQLLRKSLVLVETQAEGRRYRLLETIRQYGLEKLAAAGEKTEQRRRHREWYLSLAEAGESSLKGSGSSSSGWLQRLELEHDNLRAALDGCLEKPRDENAGLRLAGALAEFWRVKGHSNEGRLFLETFTKGAAPPSPVRAKALEGLGAIAFKQGDTAAALTALQAAMAIELALGQQQQVARLLELIGWTVFEMGEWTRARECFTEALARATLVSEKIRSLSGLSAVAVGFGKYHQAVPLLQEAVELTRTTGHDHWLANTLVNLGSGLTWIGEFAAAEAALAEGLSIYRATGIKTGIGHAVHVQGSLALLQGDFDLADKLLGEAAAILEELSEGYNRYHAGEVAYRKGDFSRAESVLKAMLSQWWRQPKHSGVPEILAALGRVAVARGAVTRGVVLVSFSVAARDASGIAWHRFYADDLDRRLDDARQVLDAAAFAAAWDQGRRLGRDAAVALALAEDGAGCRLSPHAPFLP